MSTPLAMSQLTGYDLDRKVDFCVAGAAFSKGDVVTVTGVTPSTSGGMRTITAPTSISIKYGVHGVVLDNCASGDIVQVCFKGLVQAYTQSASGLLPIAVYSPMNVTTSKNLNVDTPANFPRVIAARGLEDTGGSAASATRALRWVMFDGTQTGMDWGALGGSNALRYGGGIGSNTADSAAIASTASKTAFDKTVSIPINLLNQAGGVLRVVAAGQYSDTGTPTLAIGLDLDFGGSAPVVLHTATSAALGAGVSNKQWRAEWHVTTRTASSTTGVFSTALVGLSFDTAVVGAVANSTSNSDTTIARTLNVCATWSASSASNTVTLEHLVAQRIF